MSLCEMESPINVTNVTYIFRKAVSVCLVPDN